MSFQQGLSGLNTSSKALDTIGNNVSNAGTVGFKASSAQFADVFAASLGAGGASQIGIGAALARVQQQFTQGNIANTNSPLDLAVNGAGMYRMANSAGTITYTRAGQFQLDKNGFIENANGLRLTGYAADPITGTISPGSLVPLQVLNTNIAPKTTSTSMMQLNFDARALPPSAMSSGSLTGATPPLTTGSVVIIDATNDVLDLVVDSIPISVTIPQSNTYSASGLANTLTSLINANPAMVANGASVTVSNTSTGALIVTSNSKGTVGGGGQGSTVALNGFTRAAHTLFGTPGSTAGTLGLKANVTSGPNLPAAVTIGNGESFRITTQVMPGAPVTSVVTLTPLNNVTPAAFAAQLALDIAAAVPPPAGAVAVTAAAGQPLKLELPLNGVNAGDNISVSSMTAGISALLGNPAVTAGQDNFNQILSQTNGTLSSETALSTPLNVAPGVPGTNKLSIDIDGQALNVTLATVNYDGTAGKTLNDLAADIQTKINAALAAIPSTKSVTVGVNANNKLVIQSDSTGTSSTVMMGAAGAGTVEEATAALLFGTNPTEVPGDQTQVVNPLGFTASTAQTVYDSQGNPHNLSLYFAKTSQGNVWQMYTTLDNGQQQGPVQLTFNGSGVLTTTMPLTLPTLNNSYTFTSSNTNASQPNALQFTLDLTGTTQYGVSFGVNTLSQDGYSSGQLAGISVSDDGIIQGRFSNGQSKNMGQIVLVSFNNPNGLKSLGGNQWAEGTASGQPIPGVPGTGNLGLVQSASVEESNVDLTKELVDMITQQRAYQANAQTIKTQDQVLQTLVNLR